jgi:hypothetical protein
MYRLRYTVRPTPPLRVWDGAAEKVEYDFVVVIAEAGARRVLHPHEPDRDAIPTAAVGDTLVIPVHTDAGRTDYRFDAVERDAIPSLPRLNGELDDQFYRVQAEDWPAARVNVPAALDTITTWRMIASHIDEGGPMSSIGAYLSFASPGSFNLSARLSDEPAGVPGRWSFAALVAGQAGDTLQSCPFRVVPRDRPVTVLLAGFCHTTRHDSGGSSSVPGWVEPGTVEVRVGDRVVIDAGMFRTPLDQVPDRAGVIEALPFRDVPHYTPR